MKVIKKLMEEENSKYVNAKTLLSSEGSPRLDSEVSYEY